MKNTQSKTIFFLPAQVTNVKITKIITNFLLLDSY